MAGCMKKVENPADAIYTNGEIITMDGDSPTYPEAVATRKGKIVFVGPRLEAFKMKGDSTVIIDLLGKTLLPGFIDAHGHLSNAGFQASTANLLAPPDGSAVDMGA